MWIWRQEQQGTGRKQKMYKSSCGENCGKREEEKEKRGRTVVDISGQ